MDRFRDRQHAGKILAELLKEYANREDVIALALPRGGVPVAFEIAKALSIPLDVLIVRKLGVPNHKELAMGAIASGHVIVFNEELMKQLHVSESAINQVIKEEQEELSRRESLYRVSSIVPQIEGKTILLVDDGIATGATMKVAIVALKQQKPAQIIVAVPVAAMDTYRELKKEVDIVSPLKPIDFHAVGLWYDDFPQVDDNEVRELLLKKEKSNK